MSVTRSVMVALTSYGLCVPVLDDYAAISADYNNPLNDETVALGPAELEFLLAARAMPGATVAEVAESVGASGAPGADAGGLAAFAQELGARKLLIERDQNGSTQSDRSTGAESVPPGTGEPFDATDTVVVATPVVFRISPGGFDHLDHDGNVLVRLEVTELCVLNELRSPVTVDAAHSSHERAFGEGALDRASFDALLARARTCGLVEQVDGGVESHHSKSQRQLRAAFAQDRNRIELAAAEGAKLDDAEAVRQERTGVTRINVVPVANVGGVAPLALGMVMAYARAHDGGRLEESFLFRPEWMTKPERLEKLATEPSIFLFSNYVWSHAKNLEMSKRVKEVNPNCVTVHGGPDSPKYEGDVDTYFRAHPHIDITVRGEGEATAAELFEALAGKVGDGPADLSVLSEVAGLSYRHGDGVVRTADRDRISDLDTIPSPYLTGLFDLWAQQPGFTAIIETNRGCPYGCTFCDWGSSTLSRIRKFSLERVFDELDWVAKAGFTRIFLADANFGIFERDIDIARKIAETRSTYGYPRHFVTNYAKNTVKHLKPIVQAMVEADVLTEGLLSLQSMDTETLSTIKRSNIKLERYEDLAREFRKAKLPLYVDLMLGLPGATTASFRNDLQECMNREVTVKVFPTELLVNSPMNAPEYRKEHAVETAVPVVASGDPSSAKGAVRPLVVSTASFTRADYDEMMHLRRIFLLCENYGALRQVARYVRKESGVREIDFYEQLRQLAERGDERWPDLAATLRIAPVLMVPPASWRLFVDDVGRYVVDELGVPDDGALATVLDVQHALLPARNRQFPLVLDLPHDYAAWHRRLLDAKDTNAPGEWPDHVPHLRDFSPASFEVNDPDQLCTLAIGFRIENDAYGQWEFGASVSRPSPTTHLALD